jgi:hypothetical protein
MFLGKVQWSLRKNSWDVGERFLFFGNSSFGGMKKGKISGIRELKILYSGGGITSYDQCMKSSTMPICFLIMLLKNLF